MTARGPLSRRCVMLPARSSALAQNKAVKIGVLEDMFGPYAEKPGQGCRRGQGAIADSAAGLASRSSASSANSRARSIRRQLASVVATRTAIWWSDPNSAIALALVKAPRRRRSDADRGGPSAMRQILRPNSSNFSTTLRPDQDHRERTGQARDDTWFS